MNSLNPKIDHWIGKRVWIIGASSGIGAALAEQFKTLGAIVALSARREAPLREMAGAEDQVLPLDVTNHQALGLAMKKLTQVWDRIDMVVYCAGVYQPMRAWEMDLSHVHDALEINLHGVYKMLHVVTPQFLKQGRGAYCLVASVAGYTGLPKALAYGPGKAAMINLAQILYSDLTPRGIAVYLVNPGFVETRLTQKNDFTMPAVITPEDAANRIIQGFARGSFEIHFPKRFTWWMKRLSRLPDRLRFALLKKAAMS
jgi:short-subunit dehydrogenase